MSAARLAWEAAELAGAVTGVGSLPQRDPEAALEVVATGAPVLPFWPQLPGRGQAEGMLAQGLAGLEPLLEPTEVPWRRRIRDRGAFLAAVVRPRPWGAPEAAGLCALEAQLARGVFSQARAVKGQICGPLTLAASLELDGAPAWRDPALMRALGARVANLAGDQVARLRKRRLPVLVVVDEPGLGALPPEALGPISAPTEALCWTLAAISVSGGLAGLHCCAVPPWASLARLPLDLLSFDADRDLEAMMADSAGRALASSRAIAWGLVPADRAPSAPEQIFARWLAAVSAHLDPRILARRALVTATCGLAGRTEAEASATFAVASAVGARMQALASGAN